MKKNISILFVIVSIVMISTTAFSQGAYIKAEGGYGFNMASVSYGSNYTSTGTSSTSEEIHGSLGKGVNFGASFGVMFNENIGAELGVSYLLGSALKYKDSYIWGTYEGSAKGRMLRISPSLVITGGLEGVKPYARFGFVLGVGSKILTEDIDRDISGDVDIMKWEYTGGIATGFSGAAGVNFSLSRSFTLFLEANLISMSYAPKKGVMTENSYNGVDQLSGLTASQKEVEYVKEYTIDWSNPPPDSQPQKALKFYFPFSSAGLTLGLTIRFNKSGKEEILVD